AWYISREGVNYGPFTADDFARFESEGQLTSTDHVWCTGFDQWRLYEEYRSAILTTGRSPRASPETGPHLLARKLIRVNSLAAELMLGPATLPRIVLLPSPVHSCLRYKRLDDAL